MENSISISSSSAGFYLFSMKMKNNFISDLKKVFFLVFFRSLNINTLDDDDDVVVKRNPHGMLNGIRKVALFISLFVPFTWAVG